MVSATSNAHTYIQLFIDIEVTNGVLCFSLDLKNTLEGSAFYRGAQRGMDSERTLLMRQLSVSFPFLLHTLN